MRTQISRIAASACLGALCIAFFPAAAQAQPASQAVTHSGANVRAGPGRISGTAARRTTAATTTAAVAAARTAIAMTGVIGATEAIGATGATAGAATGNPARARLAVTLPPMSGVHSPSPENAGRGA